MTEPIIPVKPGGEFDPWFGQVASLAQVDGAVNVDTPAEDASKAADELGLALVPLANIDQFGLTSFSVHPAGIGPARHEYRAPYTICCKDGPLWEVIAAGDLTDEHAEALTGDALSVLRAPNVSRPRIMHAQFQGSTLVERTCEQFGENQVSGGGLSAPTLVWITKPESFVDCVYFWNLRALRPLRFAPIPMLIVPEGAPQSWPPLASELAHILKRPDEFAPDVVLRSSSVPPEALDEHASLLGLERYTGEPRIAFQSPAPIRSAPFTYLTNLDPRSWLIFDRSYGILTDADVQLFRSKTMFRFSSPVDFRSTGKALVRLSGAALAGLPQRPSTANLIQSGSTWRDGSLQLTTFSLNNYNFELHVPSLSEVATALLNKAASRHQLSAKGKPGMAWLDRTDISPLLEAHVFSAIRELTTPRIKRLTRELQRLRGEGAADEDLIDLAARWGGRAERSYRNVEQLEYVPHDIGARILERLCDVGWAERGLRLICNSCGLHSFVPLLQASGRAVCPGCQEHGRYETGSTLTIYYRLNSYLDHLSDQGVLPHLITIAALRKTGNNSHFLPGVDMWFSDGTKREADVFGIRDSQILNGEVKTSGSEFTREQITHDIGLSSRIEADLHIMAAIDTISEGAQDQARQECKAHGLGLIILQQSDLLPDG